MRFPVFTLLLCGIATVVFFVPPLGPAMIYNREAILGGEWWRLITGNFVHLSPAHFAADVLALLVVGTMIELRGERCVWLVYLSAGAAIGLTVYLTSPELQFFGGLSGIVTAALVYLCVCGMRDAGAWRWLCVTMLALVPIKITMEFMLGDTLLNIVGVQPFLPVPTSHLAGACAALCVYGTRLSGIIIVAGRPLPRNIIPLLNWKWNQ